MHCFLTAGHCEDVDTVPAAAAAEEEQVVYAHHQEAQYQLTQ